MKMKGKFTLTISIAILSSILIFSSGVTAEEKTTQEQEDDLPKLFVPKPTSAENFPCSKCHSYRPVDKRKRNLVLYHTNIVLKHAEKQRWCLDCHEGDKLRLPNGELIDYDKPYMLCGQCHGTIFRDWKVGIHGKTSGMWSGEKVYRVCVSCHDPHQPKFKQIEPEKQPMRPTEIKLIKKQ